MPKIISVTASAVGLESACLTIPLSADPKDAVLAVAARGVAAADTTGHCKLQGVQRNWVGLD